VKTAPEITGFIAAGNGQKVPEGLLFSKVRAGVRTGPAVARSIAWSSPPTTSAAILL